ncbi:MAG TPA: oxidoreductase, partial [Gemmatimonadaceae bacterium]
PSLLMGDRGSPRLGEEIGKRLGWIAPRRYKPILAATVAAALVQSARDDQPGLRIIESDEIRRVAERRAGV